MSSCTFEEVLTASEAPGFTLEPGITPKAPETALESALDASGGLAAQVDLHGNILFVSEASVRLLAYPREYLLTTALGEVVSTDHREELLDVLAKAWSSRMTQVARLRFTGGFAESRWLELHVAPFNEPSATPILTVFGYDVTEWVRNETQLREESLHDPLTGLGNRAMVRKRIEHYLEEGAATGFAVALLDLDGFKNINDTLGHDVGDELLKQVSNRLQCAVRAKDTVARMGGDEFVLLLEDVQNLAEASAIAERVVAAFRQPFNLGGCQLRVTTSLGLTFCSNKQTESLLIKRADLAMYDAKNQGKNRYCVYSPELERKLNEQFVLQQSMFDAVQNGEFELYYQPILNPQNSEVCAVEALMRWNHMSGPISPARFIPLAEENGLINLLGDWALRCACAQIARWDAQGLRVGYVSVNVSPVQFRHPAFADNVRRAIRESGIEASRLVLEITEGALMTRPEQAEQLLLELRELGVRFAVDDFGTGYSSLAYLRRFPLFALKIDKSFVADMLLSPHGRTIVFAVLSLARELGLVAVAEGVETIDQSKLLFEQGCQLVQGWLFSQAMTAEELERQFTSGQLVLSKFVI